ncbi:XPG I-region-domain-containing protein, partial [Suillus clintonianus]|uniref:XPG I-region-domain-containing protein n=1 Tax=Suillus clintonianus TaxID=1904413 RepID=UPI001B85F1DC
AAGEAEAQLALMNRAGVIDTIMTDDSDVFVFSGKTVLRNSTFSADTIKIYTAGAIQDQIDYCLTGDAFITMAICCGGDYDKASFDLNGLLGCRCEIALGLVWCMDNSMLHSAACSSNQDRVLDQWRNISQYHLLSDPTGRMGRSHPALSCSLSESFPSVDVINLYAYPAVTSLAELAKLQLPAPPDLAQLTSVIQQLLGWSSKKLLTTFHTNIWPVVVLHELLEDLANNSPKSNEVCDCYNISTH